ncbi:general odorant-binding protein 45-like [Uranotaenia lowii]|uniref:general odorant-binding protein 45-like n=1 Tax=Uranotaenia lowii TaxID=190385 RepID=UPI0024791828|nr:general odorant-binding protein 45-like [Uranotaenia lowii]
MIAVLKVLTATLLMGLHQLSTLQASGIHSSHSKTAFQVHTECRKMLRNPMKAREDVCEDRCEVCVYRAWDDIRGPVYGVYRVFWGIQNPGDECFVDRTYRCLWNRDQFNLTTPDPCRRATETTTCFDRYHGAVTPATIVFLNPTALHFRSIVESCRKFQQLSDQDLVHPLNSGFLDSEVTRCLLRCVIIRAGLYTDADGPNLDRLEQMYGARSIERNNFWHTGQKCVARTKLRNPEASACSLAALFVDDCFEELLQDIRTAILEIVKYEKNT